MASQNVYQHSADMRINRAHRRGSFNWHQYPNPHERTPKVEELSGGIAIFGEEEGLGIGMGAEKLERR